MNATFVDTTKMYISSRQSNCYYSQDIDSGMLCNINSQFLFYLLSKRLFWHPTSVNLTSTTMYKHLKGKRYRNILKINLVTYFVICLLIDIKNL